MTVCSDVGVRDCGCCDNGIVGTEDKSKSKSCESSFVAKQASFSEANAITHEQHFAGMIEHLRTVLPWQKLITKFSRRVRVHEVADAEQMCVRSVDIHAGKAQVVVGTAVEMKDDEDVDDRGMKDDVSVGSVASRHAHDRGIGNGIGSFGGHVPVRSRIDMSESGVCRDQDVGCVVEGSVENHDVGEF